MRDYEMNELKTDTPLTKDMAKWKAQKTQYSYLDQGAQAFAANMLKFYPVSTHSID